MLKYLFIRRIRFRDLMCKKNYADRIKIEDRNAGSNSVFELNIHPNVLLKKCVIRQYCVM